MYLNDLWTLYFHDPFDNDWTNKSYIKLSDISEVEEFWEIHNQIKDNVNRGMFFCMREHIFPCWDDPLNINGTCMSVKVLKENSVKYWEELIISILGETFVKEEYRKDSWNVVNGLSISPKKSFCIIKVWLSSMDLNEPKYFNFPANGQYGEIIAKTNNESIQSTQIKKVQSQA
jgi:hypothetical protein